MSELNDRASSSDSGGKAVSGVDSRINMPSTYTPGLAAENNTVVAYRTGGKILTDELASRVNIITIPGIRDSFITDYVSERTRDYSKAIYLMDIPAYDSSNNRLYTDSTSRPAVRNTAEAFESRAIDNNYVASYFPDVIINDEDNNRAVSVPASVVALGALGFNDSVAYPWFAPAGFNRGALENVLNTKVRLTTADRDTLYEAKINPIANFPNGGFVIFGQKTLQQAQSSLDRVNVRRMMLEVKRIVSDVALKIVFEQNTPSTRARFVSQVTPLLATIQSQQGIDQFKVIMDSSNNTQLDVEQNRLNGRIVLVPTRAVEFIAIDFIVTNAGVSFE
jgi:phage tail sheath protein FI